MKGFCSDFFNHAFHFGVRQIIQKLILYLIVVVYPYISFMNKGLSLVHILHV